MPTPVEGHRARPPSSHPGPGGQETDRKAVAASAGRWAALGKVAALPLLTLLALALVSVAGLAARSGPLPITRKLRTDGAWPSKLHHQLERLPPSMLGKWQQYAAARQCSLDDAEYAQIFSDLQPFRQAGTITQAAVEEAHRRLEHTALVTVQNGSTHGVHLSPDLNSDLVFWQDLMADFATDLPDMKLLFNLYDEPRSWTAPLPAAAEAQLADGSLTEAAAFRAHACDAVGLADMKTQHGLLASPTLFRARRGLLPILSPFKVEGCFGDILVPQWWNNAAEVNDYTLHSGCPLSDDAWESKNETAFFRGSTTGGYVLESTKAEDWQQYHRQRLVQLSKQHPGHLDAAFTGFPQCDLGPCKAMEQVYGRAPRIGPFEGYTYKYQMLVDGNGAPTRLGPSLCSGSLTMLASIIHEWFYSRLVPRRHFLPVRLDYSDLVQQVEWARQHDAEARQIAEAAAEFVNTRLREADLKCYMYRLLLEYAAIYVPTPAAAAAHLPPVT